MLKKNQLKLQTQLGNASGAPAPTKAAFGEAEGNNRPDWFGSLYSASPMSFPVNPSNSGSIKPPITPQMVNTNSIINLTETRPAKTSLFDPGEVELEVTKEFASTPRLKSGGNIPTHFSEVKLPKRKESTQMFVNLNYGQNYADSSNYGTSDDEDGEDDLATIKPGEEDGMTIVKGLPPPPAPVNTKGMDKMIVHENIPVRAPPKQWRLKVTKHNNKRISESTNNDDSGTSGSEADDNSRKMSDATINTAVSNNSSSSSSSVSTLEDKRKSVLSSNGSESDSDSDDEKENSFDEEKKKLQNIMKEVASPRWMPPKTPQQFGGNGFLSADVGN